MALHAVDLLAAVGEKNIGDGQASDTSLLHSSIICTYLLHRRELPLYISSSSIDRLLFVGSSFSAKVSSMKLSSLVVAATIVATVEGKHKKNGAKASKNNGTSFVGFGGKASKGGSGGSDNDWWSPTKDKFDVCAVADPVGNQSEILGGQSPSLEHASWVYSGFADAVKGYNSGGK